MTDQTNEPTDTFIVAAFEQGGHQFKVLKNHRHADNGEPKYIGYCNDIKSISADKADTCARALIRKHVDGLPRGKVVSLAAHVARKFEQAERNGLPRQKS